MQFSQTLSVISSTDWEKNHWRDETSPAFWVWARFAGSIFILPNTARSWYSVELHYWGMALLGLCMTNPVSWGKKGSASVRQLGVPSPRNYFKLFYFMKQLKKQRPKKRLRVSLGGHVKDRRPVKAVNLTLVSELVLREDAVMISAFPFSVYLRVEI
jgi:hypothetical protein